jgi:hypothetical protein
MTDKASRFSAGKTSRQLGLLLVTRCHELIGSDGSVLALDLSLQSWVLSL